MNYSGFSILYGEDDEDDLIFFQKILKYMNFNGEYKHFSSGNDALDWTLKRGKYLNFSHSPPDLLILDIGLKGMSGKDVLKIIRAQEKSKMIPVIIVSGSCSIDEHNECISLGCNGYIQKSEYPEQFKKNCQLFIEGWARLSMQEFF